MGAWKILVIGLPLLVLAACGGGGGSTGGSGPILIGGPQVITLTATAGDSQISFSHNTISGATGFTLYYSTSPGVTVATGTSLAMPTSPMVLPGLTNGTTYYAIATYTDLAGESAPSAQASATPAAPAASIYDPTWAAVAPTTTINHAYNGAQSATQNGTALKAAMQALTAGQKLSIDTGSYELGSNFTLNLQGTAGAPIWICAAGGATPVIYMNTSGQNILNVGVGSQSRYLCFQGLTFTGGSLGVRFYDCTQIWFDQCKIHDTAEASLSTSTADTSYIYITRNELWNTGGTGEGMYLGANNGTVKMSNSIVALNHVHDTSGPTVTQGDGIELKQGSWGNPVAENLVHDCPYPCILVYGTAGMPRNTVERNVCYNSGDNVMQVQGECNVRNNLCINGAGSAFASQPHQGNPTEMTVVHNTFINGSGRATKLSSWNGAANMLFSNNASYSNSSFALEVVGGVSGIGFAGNVLKGTVTAGVSAGTYVAGTGLSDFVNLAWDATARDAHLSAASACRDVASAANATSADLEGTSRAAPHDAGAYEGT